MTRSKAVKLFTAVGFPGAGEWEDQKLISRLALVTTRIKEEDVPDSEMMTYEELKEDPTVEFISEDGEPPAPAPKKKKATTPEPERDKEGAPLGTMKAAVNAVIAEAWKTDVKIAKEAGIGLQQARRWLRKVVADGKVEKRSQIIYRIKPKA